MTEMSERLRLIVTDELRVHMDNILANAEQLPIPVARQGLSDAALMRVAVHLLADNLNALTQADAEAYAEFHQSGNDGAGLFAFDSETYDILEQIAQQMHERGYRIPYLKAGRGWNRRMALTIAIAFAGNNVEKIVSDWRTHARTNPQTTAGARRDT